MIKVKSQSPDTATGSLPATGRELWFMGESPAAAIAILLRRRQEGEIAKTLLPSPWVKLPRRRCSALRGLLLHRVVSSF
jgi:hypothetical protein